MAGDEYPTDASKGTQAPVSRHAVNVERVKDYGVSAKGDMIIVLFEGALGSELLLRVPYSEASPLLGAVQGATKSAASTRGEKARSEISSALSVAQVTLGPTESGRIGIRLGLTNKMHFDFVVSRSVAVQFAEALRKYTSYKDSGGSDFAQ